jgi:hypothetical protein
MKRPLKWKVEHTSYKMQDLDLLKIYGSALVSMRIRIQLFISMCMDPDPGQGSQTYADPFVPYPDTGKILLLKKVKFSLLLDPDPHIRYGSASKATYTVFSSLSSRPIGSCTSTTHKLPPGPGFGWAPSFFIRTVSEKTNLNDGYDPCDHDHQVGQPPVVAQTAGDYTKSSVAENATGANLKW